MTFLKDRDVQELQKRFAGLDKPVKLIYFTQELECQFCRETRLLLEEVTALSDKLSLETYNFQLDKDKAENLGIDKIPATVIMAEEDVGIRFYGIPSGYEFASLLESIELVSSGKTPLSKDTQAKLAKIDRDVHIQVFVTPTCPYCPPAVVMAHNLAFLSKHIKADMVEATEFPHLSYKYGVMGVPRVVINETTFFEGALPESQFVTKVLEAVKK